MCAAGWEWGLSSAAMVRADRRGAAAAGAALALLTAGCGPSTTPAAAPPTPSFTVPPPVTVTMPTPTLPTPAPLTPAPPAASGSTPSAADGSAGPRRWTMPDLVGANLQDAQNAIQELTDYEIPITTSHDATGAGREQLLDRNWKVCSQNVPAGTPIGQETRIDFGTVRTEERCRSG